MSTSRGRARLARRVMATTDGCVVGHRDQYVDRTVNNIKAQGTLRQDQAFQRRLVEVAVGE